MTTRTLVALLLLAASAFAQGTKTWNQSTFEDFDKGTSSGVAISSDGTLRLAPAFQTVYTTPSTYLWSLAVDGSGAIYAAAGSPARVYRITPDGQASIVFQPEELQVQALAVDRAGLLFAATSPDGKVYRITPKQPPSDKKDAKSEAELKPDSNYTASVFFEPRTKYIWDLALDGEGRLYVATGDRGEIYRVDQKGVGSVFFKSDEAHIRTLAFDAKENVIAGSDGSGLIYRISPAGEAFVLYSAAKKEITALAVDAAGNIYAAGVGEKRAGPVGPGFAPPPPQPTPAPAPPAAGAPSPHGGAQAPQTAPTPTPPPVAVISFGGPSPGSEIYRISPEGASRRIWGSREDIVYALGFDGSGALLAGTGNKGRIFKIHGERKFTSLLKASATQVTGFAKAPNGGLYVSTSNLGKVFALGAAPDTEGAFESDVLDARVLARWGRAEVRSQGSVDLLLRSGNVDNPDRNWSPWKKVDLAKDGATDVPPARFVQWKAVLKPGERPAELDSVTLNYRPNNVAPVVEDVLVQVGGAPRPKPADAAMAAAAAASQRFEASAAQGRGGDPDSIPIRWMARDDNDDDLVYSLYYRGDGERRWKLLKQNLREKSYLLDSNLLPDGGYTVRVVASDAPSRSPDEALTDEKVSARFEVDTTPPRIDDLRATLEGGEIRFTFRASDSFSPIKRAEYSVDAGEWQFIEPIGQLSDSRTESYDVAAPLPADAAPAPRKGARKEGPAEAAEHLVVVRVYDRFDNLGAAKAVVATK